MVGQKHKDFDAWNEYVFVGHKKVDLLRDNVLETFFKYVFNWLVDLLSGHIFMLSCQIVMSLVRYHNDKSMTVGDKNII